jgi:hypothetical protein
MKLLATIIMFFTFFHSVGQKINLLDSVTVFSQHVPETLVGKIDYSIFDFEFIDDKFILLTSENSLNDASIKLSNDDGEILDNFDIPKQAGKFKNLTHDFQKNIYLICEELIYKIEAVNIRLCVSQVTKNSFYTYIFPVADSADNYFYFSNKTDMYPSFNYYFAKLYDTIPNLLGTVTNKDLLRYYNLEYYYLPPRAQLEARRTAAKLKIDKHIVAAMMSGFTQNMYYEPIYAPLLIFNDTIHLFNHYENLIYHYNKQHKLIDSVKIDYHHPKNWREWKKKILVDDSEKKCYAMFSKNCHYYLKRINYFSGKEILTYHLKNHSAENLKIKNGYVYYVYRPFSSTQEKFLYREKIE